MNIAAGPIGQLSRATGALATIVVTLACLGLFGLAAVELFARFVLATPIEAARVEAVQRLAGWGLVAGIVLGLPRALLESLVADGDTAPSLRSHLSLRPGLPVALILGLGAAVALAALAPEALGGLARAAFGVVAAPVAAVPLAILLSAAVLGGAKPPESAAALAAPALLVATGAQLADAGIARGLLGAALPYAVAAGVALLALATAPWRKAIWWIVGCLLVIPPGLMLTPGLFTPGELASLLALAAMPVAIVLHVAVGRAPVWRMFRTATVEIVSYLVALMAGVAVAALLARLGVADFVKSGTARLGPAPLALALFALGFLALSLAMTPVLALALVWPLAAGPLARSGVEGTVALVAAALAGHLALVARAIRSDATGTGPTRASGGWTVLLGPNEGWPLALALVAALGLVLLLPVAVTGLAG